MTVVAVAAAALLALVATPLLARRVRRSGRGDAARGDAAARKPQRAPVPTVGGTAVAGAVVLAALVAGDGEVLDPLGVLGMGEGGVVRLLVWCSVAAAFALGALDDALANGLRPGSKVLGQAAAASPLAVAVALAWSGPLVAQSGWPAPLAAAVLAGGAVLAAVAAMNVANTFDNHDGALAAVGVVGFAPAAPAVAAALAGFLPWNLDARGTRHDPGATPTAYLGDAGSHLVGLLAVANPAAWPLLVLPAVDLARLAVVRWRTGSRPWIGDRRHLAHALAARGWSRRAVCGALALAAAPACLGAALAREHGTDPERSGFLAAASASIGLGVSLALAGWLLALARRQRP